ncbi:TolC family protein [Horticoccus sp. 23ND18S-11]|uniref:TolC family protein n=1 Tax=Horticoccus sp. 23ND18S-11 TaxID=3391832 RepID=UPI0039C8F9DA
MRSVRFAALRGSLFALLALASRGQTPPPEASPQTLAQTLSLVAERHPALTAQSYEARAAEGRIEQAGLRPNPTLEASVENVHGTGRVQGVRSLEATVQGSQTFERGGKREKRVAFANRERDTATRELAVRRTEVLASAASAHIALLAAQQRLALAAEPLRLARETITVIDARLRAGAASQVESARARVALVTAEAEFARAEAALISARAALASTWSGTLADVVTAAGTLRTPDALPAEAALRARLAVHPRLDLQAAVIASRRAALELEQAQAAQDVTASGGIRFLREGTDAAFVAGVSVPLPVRNRNQGNIRAARETVAGAEHAVRAIEAELNAAFTAAWQDLVAAHTLAQKLRRDALPATEDAHAAVRRAYESGSIPLIDVLDAQRALVALRRELLAADADYVAALARLEALTDSTYPAVTALIRQP